MYYSAIAILLLVIVYFIYRECKHQSAMSQASEVILDTLRKNTGALSIDRTASSAMSVADIHYVVTQAEIDVSINDIYHQLTLLCESKLVRCHSESVLEDGKIITHGTFAIDTITDHSRV